MPAHVAVPPTTSVAQRVRGDWDPEQVRLIKATVAKDASDAELGLFLELARRYELDPFSKQIWAARLGGNNGPVSIFVGRDGLLTIANRHPDFRGLEAGAVYQHDEYDFDRQPDGRLLTRHRPRNSEGKPSAVDRGELVLAYAVARREGRSDTFFEARLDEYLPKNPSSYSPWSKQRAAMLKKCAESNALRIAYSITGLVPEEETQANRIDLTAPPSEPEYGEGPEGDWLRELVAEANRLQPGSYRPARLAALMGASDFEREALAASLVEFIVERSGDVPVRPEPVVDAEPADEVAVDDGEVLFEESD